MITLREYQQIAVDHTIGDLITNTGHPLIVEPTGTGKSIVIGALIHKLMTSWPGTRCMVLTHVKELVEQDTKAIKMVWPQAPVGVYSAGLGERDTDHPIIVGGVASVINAVDKFGDRHIVFVDEAHRISPESATMYGKVLAALRERCPNLRVIGLSATPYRLGSGHLTDGKLFTHVAIDQTTPEWFHYLIEAGYLASVVPRKPGLEYDLAGVKKLAGDYNLKQLEKAVTKGTITEQTVADMVKLGQGRSCWLVFAAGVKHAIEVASTLREHDVPAEAIYGELPGAERDDLIERFRSGALKALVNNNVLTTGFDHPPIDMIGMLRPTTSTSLWVQMVGRGMRPSTETGKENCLVLDYAGNTMRLGPIDDPVMPRKGKGGDGAPPVKICPECECYNHASATICAICGFEFPRNTEPDLSIEASTLDLLRATKTKLKNADEGERITVGFQSMTAEVHPVNPRVLTVTYTTEHRTKAYRNMFFNFASPQSNTRAWWKKRSERVCPRNAREMAAVIATTELRQPRKLRLERRRGKKTNRLFWAVVTEYF